MAIGTARIIAIPTMSTLPIRASAMPPFSPKSAAGLVKKSSSSWLIPLKRTVPSTSASRRDGEERAQERQHRHELLDPAAAAEVVRRGRDVVRIGDLGGAHPVDILRAFWNLFTISWAETFVTSEITSRIAPR